MFRSVSGSRSGSFGILINPFFIIKLRRFWRCLCSPDNVHYLTLETDINKYEKRWSTSSSVWAQEQAGWWSSADCQDLLLCLGCFNALILIQHLNLKDLIHQRVLHVSSGGSHDFNPTLISTTLFSFWWHRSSWQCSRGSFSISFSINLHKGRSLETLIAD